MLSVPAVRPSTRRRSSSRCRVGCLANAGMAFLVFLALKARGGRRGHWGRRPWQRLASSSSLSSSSSSSSEPYRAARSRGFTWPFHAVHARARTRTASRTSLAGVQWPLPTSSLSSVQTCDGKVAATGSNEQQRQRHYVLEQALGSSFAALATTSAAATTRTGRLTATAARRGE